MSRVVVGHSRVLLRAEDLDPKNTRSVVIDEDVGEFPVGYARCVQLEG